MSHETTRTIPKSDRPASLEPLAHVAYLFDGSLEGLLSAIFASYANHEVPEDMLTVAPNSAQTPLQQRLGQSVRFIETDFDHAVRVRNGIVREGGNESFEAILRASCADDPYAAITVYRFVRFLMDKRARRNKRRSPLEDLANPIVNDLMRLRERVINEEEHMRQFIRFNQLENRVWFARCHPNCALVPLIMGHFHARFGDEPFMIFDEAHTVCGVCDGKDWRIVLAAPEGIDTEVGSNALYEEAWKRFYRALSIDARFHPELRRQLMPVRFWKDLPEMQPLAAGLA